MIGDDELGERLVAAQNDVAAVLAFFVEAGSGKHLDTISPGNAESQSRQGILHQPPKLRRNAGHV